MVIIGRSRGWCWKASRLPGKNQKSKRGTSRGKPWTQKERDFIPSELMGEQVQLAKTLKEADRKAGNPIKDFQHYTHEAAKQMGMIKT